MSPSLFRQNLNAILLCLGAWFLFSVLDALTKVYTQTYPVWQLLAMSSITGTLISGGWILYRYGWSGFKTPNWKLFILRGLLIIPGAYFTLKALSMISLADFYGVVFMAPFLVTIMSVIFLKESIGIHRIIALIVGFIGVVVLAGPRFDSQHTGLLAVFLATFIGSVSTIIIRKIGREKVSALYAFVPFFASLLMYVPISLFNNDALYIPENEWGLIIPFSFGLLGFFGFLAYGYGLTRATETALVSSFHYSQMIWGVLFGFLIFNDIPAHTTIIGSLIILCAGLYLLWREYVHHKINHSVSATVTVSGTISPPEG